MGTKFESNRRTSNPSLVPTVQEGKPNRKAQSEEKNQLQVISVTLQQGEDLIVGKRLREILSAARNKAGKPA